MKCCRYKIICLVIGRINIYFHSAGTLLREVKTTSHAISDSRVLCRNPESEEYFHCAIKDLEVLTEVNLLRSESSFQYRY